MVEIQVTIFYIKDHPFAIETRVQLVSATKLANVRLEDAGIRISGILALLTKTPSMTHTVIGFWAPADLYSVSCKRAGISRHPYYMLIRDLCFEIHLSKITLLIDL